MVLVDSSNRRKVQARKRQSQIIFKRSFQLLGASHPGQEAAGRREGGRPEMELELSSRQAWMGGSLYGKVAVELGKSNRFAQHSGGNTASMWV